MHRSDWVTNCLLMPMQVPVCARRSHYAWVKQAVSTSCSFRPCNALNLVSCLLVPPVTGLALFSAFYRPGSVRPQPQLSGLILVPVRVDSQKVEVEAGRAQRNSIGVIALPPAGPPPEKGTAASCGALPAKMARPSRTAPHWRYHSWMCV
jgi:hypothetical protein